MLKFSAADKKTGRPAIGIGLSRANCENLLAGRPIVFNTANMPPLPEIEIMIFAGEDEGAITTSLLKNGVLRPDQIREDPRLADPHLPIMPDKEKN